MPPKPQLQRPSPALTTAPPLLPALFLLLAPLAWPFFEYYSVLGFGHGAATYDPLIESLSDLGVDYRQVHPLKHHNVQSFRHQTINFDFLQAGVCFGLAQVGLLWSRGGVKGRVGVLRAVCTVLYVAGMVLFATIHGGPREKFWKIIGWHWNGLVLAAVAGNLNSILAAAVPGSAAYERSALYRAVCMGLGAAGLYSFYRWAFTLGEWNYLTQLGLWERGCVYPVLGWELVTGVAVVVDRVVGSGSDGLKGKKA